MDENEVHGQREDMKMKNKALRTVQREWMENIVNHYVEQNQDVVFSHPFFFGIPEAFENQPCIMIVGQEPDDFDPYSRDLDLEKLQRWVIDYLMVQLREHGSTADRGLQINNSPFWRAFRLMRGLDKCVCWNNIDKIHRIGPDRKTQPLSLQDEEMLNHPYGQDNKSLLQREIEITRPDSIWMVVGPDRAEDIEISFGLSRGTLRSCRPRKEQWISEIGKKLKMDIPAYWTYHPAYLNRLGVLSRCVQCINEKLDRGESS